MLDLNTLAKFAERRVYKKGDAITTEGDLRSKDMFVLVSGEAGVYKNYGKENAVAISTLAPGELFGELTLFCAMPQSATVLAIQDAVALAVSKQAYTDLSKGAPELGYQITQALCERLDAANKAVLALTPKDEGGATGVGSFSVLGSKPYFFPENHGTYPVVEPETYKNFVTHMKKICPVCQKAIEVNIQMPYKEKPSRAADSDMRRYIIDFEPLWYNILTCPSCYFSMLDDVFSNKEILMLRDIDKKLGIIRAGIQLDFKGVKTLDMVFASYYIALECSSYYINFKQLQARLWLEISWLYDIAGDAVMCNFATEKAAVAYTRMYEECKMSVESEQGCCLVLGTLCERLGRYEDAVQYLFKVKMQKQGNRIYIQNADNKIYEIREKMRANKPDEPAPEEKKKKFW